MLKHINLQLFAEEPVKEPAKVEGTNLDKKLEPSKDTLDIRKIFGLKEPKKKEPEKKTEPDVKPENKKPDEVKAPNTMGDKTEKAEPEFYEIPYMKDKDGTQMKVKIPVTERDTYLQKGYNYDKVKTDADIAKAALLRAAKLEGFDKTEDYLAELDKREKAKMAEKIEEAAGDPDKIDEIINKRIENHPKVVETQEKDRKNMFKEITDELKNDRFYKELEPQFNGMVGQNPTVDPKLLYKLVRSDYLTPEKINELIAKEKESTEKKVIADQHDKERRAAPKGGDAGDGNEVVQPTEFAKKISNIFGVSPQKVAQRSHEKLKRS